MAKKCSGDIYSTIKHHIINIVALILLVIAVLELIMMKIPRGGPSTVPTAQQPCSQQPRKAPVRKKKTKRKQHKSSTLPPRNFIM